MSRITAPVTKFSHAMRSLHSSANAAHPSGLLESRARHLAYLPRKISHLQAECARRQLKTTGSKTELVDRLAAHDLVFSQGIHTSGGHRPAPAHTTTVYRTIPLMQGFQTSAPKQAAGDTSTIDFFFFPEVPEPPPANPFAKLRVPLLPDNYNPDRSADSAHAVDTPDEAVPRSEISIIASHPENVGPAALSEVVGNGGVEIDLHQLTAGFSSTAAEGDAEPGVIKELWNSLVDDILGPKSGPPKALA